MTVKGFLNGLWGKPAVEGTGVLGTWSKVRKTAGGLTKVITAPIGMMKVVITGMIIAILYVTYKKVK